MSSKDESDDLIPEKVEEYRTKSYWDRRYEKCKEDETYEWFKGYDYFSEFILPFLKKSDKILMLGCGNSRFSEEMCAEGFESIVNVDYSEKVIEMMAERTRDTFPTMKWLTADFRDMRAQFSDSSFDVVLDKGSLDALWSDGGSQWDPSEQVLKDINAALDEILRLLRPQGGRFISITFGQPHFRLPHMTRESDWKLISSHKLGLYYIYIFDKH